MLHSPAFMAMQKSCQIENREYGGHAMFKNPDTPEKKKQKVSGFPVT
jgi:hypothetical protein